MTAPPQHCPSPRELDDLDLLLLGVRGEAPSYTADDPLSLHVPPEVEAAAVAAGFLEIVDPEGLPLARVAVEQARGGHVLGPIEALTHVQHGAFRRLVRGPGQVRADHPDAVTVPVAGPLTDLDLASITARAAGRPVLLLALSGHGTPSYAERALPSAGLVRATLEAARLLPDAAVVSVPLASRGPGFAEADHALGMEVVAAYAPGEVIAISGAGELSGVIADIVGFEVPPADRRGLVVFFTGLSGSGKSTLAQALHDLVLEQGERTVTSLDGDVVRRNLSAGLTFSKADRETNIRRIGWVAAEISRHGGVAICSPIAPFDATRRQVRALVEDAGGVFFLVHVATPLEECERRDRKGLYAKARAGEIPEFTGISSPYEVPADADVVVDTTGRSISEALTLVLDALADTGHLMIGAPRG